MSATAVRLLAALAGVALAVTSALAPSCRPAPKPAKDALQEAFRDDGLIATEARGHRLFVQHCATCHGATGRGDGQNAYNLDPPPPDFQQSLAKLTPAERRTVVESGTAALGRSALCPAWGRTLRAEDVDALVAWLDVASRPASGQADAPSPRWRHRP